MCCIFSYDHLVRLLTRVMDERPENAVDVIEDLSLEVKRSMWQEKQSTLREAEHTTSSELLAEQQKALFNHGDEKEHEEVLVRRVFFQGDSMIAVAFSPGNPNIQMWLNRTHTFLNCTSAEKHTKRHVNVICPLPLT